MAEEGSWDTTLEEWVLSEGYCTAAAMAQKADYKLYAAAPVAGEAGWGMVYKDDHEEQITQEDGETTKPKTISEVKCLQAVVETGKAPEGGFWLGGEKFTVTQYESAFEMGDYTYVTVFANKPKKGVHIIATDSQVVVGIYDETIEVPGVGFQNAGNAKKVVLAFAEYLMGQGY